MTGVYDLFFFFFQAEDGIRDVAVTGVQTCALPILGLGAIPTFPWIGASKTVCAPHGRNRVVPANSPIDSRRSRHPAGPLEALSMFQTARSRLVAAAAILFVGVVFGVACAAGSAERDATGSADRDTRRGQWFLDPASKRDAKENLRLSFRRYGAEGWQSWGSEPLSIGDLEGLTAEDLASEAHAVSFRIRRDGGTFQCRGSGDRPPW